MNHMTNFEDQPPPAVGAYWIKEEEYSALMKVFDDGVTMPRTWKEWLKIAEEMERGLKAYGHVVMRVHIDPKTFPDWCAAHGTSTGREGRRRFVAAAVTERYGNQTWPIALAKAPRTAFLPGSGSGKPGVDRTVEKQAGLARFVKVPAADGIRVESLDRRW
jgi:hypothetical protein